MDLPAILYDPCGEFGLVGALIGAASGTASGYIGGMQTRNGWGGIAGAVQGFVIGATTGFSFGGTAGGAIGGAIGGFGGNAVGKTLIAPESSKKERLMVGVKGALIGIIAGLILGKLGTVGKNLICMMS